MTPPDLAAALSSLPMTFGTLDVPSDAGSRTIDFCTGTSSEGVQVTVWTSEDTPGKTAVSVECPANIHRAFYSEAPVGCTREHAVATARVVLGAATDDDWDVFVRDASPGRVRAVAANASHCPPRIAALTGAR